MKKKNQATQGTPLPVPLGGKSYLQDWLKRLGINHSKGDMNLRDDADGWRCLTAKILAEIVCAAAQTEDITLAKEAKEWLTSPTAEMMFEECNLNYHSLGDWLASGCPLPEDPTILSFEQKPLTNPLHISSYHLAIEGHDWLFREDISSMLDDLCEDSAN